MCFDIVPFFLYCIEFVSSLSKDDFVHFFNTVSNEFFPFLYKWIHFFFPTTELSDISNISDSSIQKFDLNEFEYNKKYTIVYDEFVQELPDQKKKRAFLFRFVKKALFLGD